MQIKDLAAKVEALGLTEKEARVYVAALFLGPSSAQKIASQAEVNRATAYVILDQLADLGLISQSTEAKKTVFVAEPPEALGRIFDQQRELIEGRQQQLKQLLPELNAQRRGDSTVKAPSIRYYRGHEGVKAAEDELRRKSRVGSIIYALTNYDEIARNSPDIFVRMPKARLKKKLSSKVIYSYKGGEVPTNPSILRETHKIEQPVKADIALYEDRAALLNYTENSDDAIGVIIEDKDIVGALRQLFELAWDSTKKGQK